VPDDLAWQARIERLAAALLACVGRHRCICRIFLRGLSAGDRERFGFIEQTKLVRFALFARRAKQFALVRSQPLFREIPLRCHQP
jgi:hypothetical protein